MNIFVTIPKGDVLDTFLPSDVRETLASFGNVRYNELPRQMTKEELIPAIADCDAVVLGWGSPAVTGDVLEGNERLRLIVHTGGSVADYVDAGTYAHGVKVISGNRLYAQSVAEGCIAYLLSVLRYIPDEVYELKNGGWQNPAYHFNETLLKREIGIIGVGMVSRYLMKMLHDAFDCTFRVYDTYDVDPAFLASVGARRTSMDEVLACSIVSLHWALNDNTRGSIGRRELEKLPHGAVFLNTSRGAIVRQSEMTELLAERTDLRVMLDVYEREPLPVDDPLRKMKNVYLMPHRGGPTVDWRAEVGRQLAEDIRHFLAGKALVHEIDAAYASRMTTQKH